MGTRSNIIVQMRNGKFGRIYCHWDGNIGHNGRILFDHYQDIKKTERLIKLGDISSLGEEIGRKHDFNWRMKYAGLKANHTDDAAFQELSKMCNAYGRDRGEKGTGAVFFDTLSAAWPDSDTGTEFTYVFADLDDGTGRHWLVGDPDEGAQTLRDLGAVLHGEESEPATAIKAFGGNFVIGHR